MDNASWQFRVPDDSQYWVEMVKCQHACPVHTDACGYVTAIAEGRYEDAYRIARATNRKFLPNLQKVTLIENGRKVQKVLCTKCIRTLVKTV